MDIFFLKGSTGDTLVVEVLHVDMLTDVMTVSYKNKEYFLNFDPYTDYYVGTIDGKAGYVL